MVSGMPRLAPLLQGYALPINWGGGSLRLPQKEYGSVCFGGRAAKTNRTVLISAGLRPAGTRGKAEALLPHAKKVLLIRQISRHQNGIPYRRKRWRIAQIQFSQVIGRPASLQSGGGYINALGNALLPHHLHTEQTL